MCAISLQIRRIVCPLPVLRASKRLKAMAAGEVLEIWADDPAAPGDFRQFCKATGHHLRMDETRADGAAVLRIEKAASRLAAGNWRRLTTQVRDDSETCAHFAFASDGIRVP